MRILFERSWDFRPAMLGSWRTAFSLAMEACIPPLNQGRMSFKAGIYQNLIGPKPKPSFSPDERREKVMEMLKDMDMDLRTPAGATSLRNTLASDGFLDWVVDTDRFDEYYALATQLDYLFQDSGRWPAFDMPSLTPEAEEKIKMIHAMYLASSKEENQRLEMKWHGEE